MAYLIFCTYSVRSDENVASIVGLPCAVNVRMVHMFEVCLDHGGVTDGPTEVSEGRGDHPKSSAVHLPCDSQYRYGLLKYQVLLFC